MTRLLPRVQPDTRRSSQDLVPGFQAPRTVFGCVDGWARGARGDDDDGANQFHVSAIPGLTRRDLDAVGGTRA